MKHASFSRFAVLKAVAGLIAVVAIAWYIPFDATAEGDIAAAPAPLSVTCDATPNPVTVDNQVTWTAHPVGGNTYFYEWTGDGNFPGGQSGANYQTVHATYENAGTRHAHVRVVSGQQTAEADCSVVVKDPVTPEPLTVTCSATPNPADPNSPVTWSANVSGGTTQDHYAWTGDNNFPGPNAGTSGVGVTSVTATYANPGTKNASVTVNSSGNRTATAQCSVQIRDNAPPPATCNASVDVVDAAGNPFNPWNGSSITQSGSNATVVVKNKSTSCTYNVGLATYKTGDYVPGQEQAFIDGQQLNANDTVILAPGQTATLSAAIPSCNWQADLFTYKTGSTATPVPPDFARLTSTHTLLDWNVHAPAGGSCFDTPPPPPPLCVPNRAAHLQATEVTVNAQGQAVSTVTNVSTACSYNVAMVSYKVGTWDFNPATRNEFLANQQVFDSDVHPNLAPGQSVTLSVSLPQCNYQVDVFEYEDGADATPDNGLILDQGHGHQYWLLKFKVNLDNGGSCLINQCPAAPTITSQPPVANNVPVGTAYNYTVTTSGGVAPVAVTITPVNPAPGLTINGATLSGTLTTPGVYSYTVSATSAGSQSNSCGVAQTIHISVGANQCPAAPTITSVPPTGSFTTGQAFSYTVTTSGGVAPVAVSIAPVGNPAPGLTINGSTISGNLTTAGTYTYRVTALSAGSDSRSCAVTQDFTITVGGICPIVPPLLTDHTDTVTRAVGVPMSYTIKLSQGQAPLTYEIAAGQLPPGLALTGNTISGTPTQAADATVVIRVANQCGADTMTLRIITTGQCVPPTITSEGSHNGRVGEPFSFTIKTSGGTAPVNVSLEGDLPEGLTYSTATQTISGTPTETGTFTLTVRAQGGSGGSICAATMPFTITIDRKTTGDDDDDSSHHGGGRRRPNVVLFSEPEVAGASISLAQVPYTGLPTSILQIVLFIIGLLAISAGIVYAATRALRRKAATAFGPAAYESFSEMTYDEMTPIEPNEELSYEEYMRTTTPRPAQVMPAAPRAPRYDAPVAAPAALEQVSEPVMERPMPAPVRPATIAPERAPQVAQIDPARIQLEARGSRTLISDDAAALIAHAAEGNEKQALERLSQVIDIAKTRYPREDGWLILDKDRVRESLFISTLSMIPLFVEWMVRGEDKKVFTFLRMLKHQEQPVADFMRKVVAELDTAHRARLEGEEERSQANPHIAEVTYHLSNKELESIVAELLHGVDERYDSAYTSVRLSLVRVLDMIKERMLRAVGTPYAFSQQEEA